MQKEQLKEYYISKWNYNSLEKKHVLPWICCSKDKQTRIAVNYQKPRLHMDDWFLKDCTKCPNVGRLEYLTVYWKILKIYRIFERCHPLEYI